MRELIASGMLYAGGVTLLVGLVCVVRPVRFLKIRTRRAAAVLAAVGLLLCLGAVAIPAKLHRVASRERRIDDYAPAYQFAERHTIRVHAPAGRVAQAIRKVTAREIRLFRLLTWLRAPRPPGRPGRESILAPSPDRPILDVALGSGFILLAEEPREVVLGTLLGPPVVRPAADADIPRLYAAFDRPGYAKAVMSFALADAGRGWTLVTTETRVYATDPAARRNFAGYWRAIYPGSALIRRMWLQAIKRRAEGRP